ncbi:MAG: glycosyltransferase family 2 protein [Bacteroidota bacterium]|nr:glycosyltransferase family 2 protein [Bacteroidota bacterium]
MISIISICYNNLEGLKKTLEIFNNHSFGNEIEIVIVDGGSIDGTKAYLKEQTISTNFVSEPDKGIYNAMNKGLFMAKGQYVWFLNAGDYPYDKTVIDQIIEVCRKNPDAIYGETMMVDKDGKHLGTRSDLSTRRLPSQLTWESFKMGMSVSHQSFIIKKTLAMKYDESYKYVSDIDWMIRCLKNCHQNINLHRIIACFTLDGFSTQKRKESNQERFTVLQKQYGVIPNLINHLFIAIRKLGNKSKM